MPVVDITNPVPPDWYVRNTNLAECVELVRNGTAVFWRVERTHPDRVAPGDPVKGPPVHVADYGLFLPGSGDTPEGAELYAPPAGKIGLGLPGVPQYAPDAPGYPVVKTGAVLVNISGNGISFRVA